MKNTKICPKCNSNDVLPIKGDYRPYRTNLTLLSQITVTKYLCCNCGFTEDWIDNLRIVDEIKKINIKHSNEV